MNISERIKKARQNRGLSLSELSDLTRISKSTLQRYETSATKKIPIEAISILEKALKLKTGYLMGWEDTSSDIRALSEKYDNIRPIEKKRFPVLGEIACGQPMYANQDYETFIEASADIKADFCLVAHGDSMINARIFDGDIVFIRSQSDVDNGEIAAVIIDNEATLKRVYKYPNRLELRPENPVFDVLNYEGEELNHIHILGKAIAFQSNIK